jgi:hypothetical protein
LRKLNSKISYFNPYNPLFIFWETGIFLFLLFELIQIPYQVSFISSDLNLKNSSLNHEGNNSTQVNNNSDSISYSGDSSLPIKIFILIIDSLIQINTKAFKDGNIIESRKTLFKIYLSNRFLIDAASIYSLTLDNWFKCVFFIKILQIKRFT